MLVQGRIYSRAQQGIGHANVCCALPMQIKKRSIYSNRAVKHSNKTVRLILKEIVPCQQVESRYTTVSLCACVFVSQAIKNYSGEMEAG